MRRWRGTRRLRAARCRRHALVRRAARLRNGREFFALTSSAEMQRRASFPWTLQRAAHAGHRDFIQLFARRRGRCRRGGRRSRRRMAEHLPRPSASRQVRQRLACGVRDFASDRGAVLSVDARPAAADSAAASRALRMPARPRTPARLPQIGTAGIAATGVSSVTSGCCCSVFQTTVIPTTAMQTLAALPSNTGREYQGIDTLRSGPARDATQVLTKLGRRTTSARTRGGTGMNARELGQRRAPRGQPRRRVRRRGLLLQQFFESNSVSYAFAYPGFAFAHVPADGVDPPGNRGFRHAEDRARFRVAHALGVHQQRGFLHAFAELLELGQQLQRGRSGPRPASSSVQRHRRRPAHRARGDADCAASPARN